MDRSERVDASVTEEGRHRPPVEGVADHAIYLLDADGVVTSCHLGARRLDARETRDIVGRHFACLYTEEDRAAGVPGHALDTAAGQGRFEREGWRVREDGTRVWAHVVVEPIRDRAGAVVGFAEIARDLSGRRLAGEALRRSEEQLRLLIQSVTDYAIYMLDPTGRVVSWNVGAQRIKGYRPDEIIGEHFSRFYTDEDRAAGAPERALETAAQVGRYEKEGWRVRKDGSRFLANVVVDAIRDDEGRVIGFAKITRDVTEQREAQYELEQAREALFQAQKMEALGQLTGGIAHDFNNILMAVLSGLALMRKRLPDDPKLIFLIDNVAQAAERGASLTQRMLAFARRQELRSEAVDLQALVAGVMPLLRQSLGPSVTVETRFPPALSAVQVDANQVELALLNLAVNARDAMPAGGPILIAAEEHVVPGDEAAGLAAGRYVSLALTDKGEGMDEETLTRAREPFFTTKGVGKGTGLGLSMVHGLAEQSGGRLVLKSRKGEGTTAELWLPAATDATKRHGDDASLPMAQAEARPLVILAVDDDPIVLRNTAAMLEDLGHAVLEAGSGKEALKIFRRARTFDLVITDQVMPHMSGVQLAAAIRAENATVPIILATGYADLAASVATDLPRLAKPFRQEDLARGISRAMRVDA